MATETNTVVVKLVVAADGALRDLAAINQGMEATANSAVKAGAGVEATTAQITRMRVSMEQGTPVLKAHAEQLDRELRIVQNLSAKYDPITKARITAERELGRGAAAASNLVIAGKMSEADAIRAVTAIEQAHVAQINKVIAAQYGLTDAVEQTRAEYAAMATAERLAATSADGQAQFGGLAGIKDGATGKSARDSAAVFEQAAREADAYAAKVTGLRAQLDPLTVAQDRYTSEVAEYLVMAKQGSITTTEFAAAQAMAKTKLDATAASLRGDATAIQQYNKSASGAAFQSSNIAMQFQDIAVSAQMGMNPMMIALQQGTQLSAVFNQMQNPLKSLGSAFLSIINPVSLLTIGFVALAAVSAQWLFGMIGGQKEAVDALEEHDKWLDKILEGYDDARKAAKDAADEALRMPQGAVESDLRTSLIEQADAAAKLDAKIAGLKARLGDLVGTMQQAANLSRGVGATDSALEDSIATLAAMQALATGTNMTAAQIDDLMVSVRELFNTTDNGFIRELTSDFYEWAKGMRQAAVIAESTKAALKDLGGLTDVREFMPGTADAIEDIKRQTEDLRTEGERLRDLFAAGIMGARSLDEARAFIAAFDNMQRAANAATWAIANSGDAAVVAADQYGTAEGAANAYSNALYRLGSMIPKVAAAQAAAAGLQGASNDYGLGLAALREEYALGTVTIDEYVTKQDALVERYKEAQDAISGVTAAEEMLANVAGQNSIGALTGREQALARVTAQYAEQEKAILATYSSEADITRLLTANSEQLAVAQDNVNAQFDRTAAKAGSARTTTEKLADAYGDILAKAQDFIGAQQAEADGLGQTAEAAAALKYEQQLLADATAKNINLDSLAADELRTKGEELRNMASAMAKAEVATDKAAEAEKRRQQAYEQTGAAIQSMFGSLMSALGVDTGKNPIASALEAALGPLMKGDWIGAAIAGIAGLVKGFVGMKKAAEEAAKKLEAAAEAERKRIEELNLAALKTAQEDLVAAYKRQADALRDVIDRNKDFIKSLQAFKASLKLDSKLSPLSPQDKLIDARKQFEAIQIKAMAGDVGAQGQLEKAARDYLDAARGFYASSDQYRAIFAQVQGAIDAAIGGAEKQISSAEAQLKALYNQVDVLVDIDKHVLTVAQAIANLTSATLMVNGGGAVPTVTSGPYLGGGVVTQGAVGRPARGGNDNGAVVAELRAVRAEVARLQQVTATGAVANVNATGETTAAARRMAQEARNQALRRSA